MSAKKDVEKRKADVRALLALINSSTEDAMASWEHDEGTVPGLDDEPEDTSPSPVLLRSMRVLDGACYQLTYLLRPTFMTSINQAWGLIEAACMRVAIHSKAADFLNDKPDGAHINEIAKNAGLDADKLGRILRLLTMKHVFREVSKDVFANNRGSYAIRSSDPRCAFLGFMVDEVNKYGFSNVYDALADPEYGPSRDDRRSVFSWGIRDEMPNANIFEWYNKHPELFDRFSRAMTAIKLGLINEFYPVASLPVDTKWCDVGGGMGGALVHVANTNPKLRMTLQDMPNVVEQARQHMLKECPQQVKGGRVSFVPIDFMKEPPVPDQDIYYMRFIIHDWPDANVLNIMRNVRKAMKPSSRYLIHDLVLTVPTDKGASQSKNVNAPAQNAPPPLLPNYGAGGIRPFLADINIMTALNARERSVEDVVHLANQVGLEFVRFWDGVETGAIELKAA
ncbi:hypothetical protein EWM64_g8430 [Hericium alpestre]|uniref:O-methyltransferase C-terminal domain-containing protein n=1 Tax=Hericium alpestre TaxID=135208 RepID=A0A4Y9ZLD5_9AGAM|nr:hypothetical protein EWM64_g8430 [Hericium alpestre]